MASGSHGSLKVIVIALIANFCIALAKFAGAFVSGSASMLAEAIHSLVDSANQGLLIVGHKSSRRAPDERYPLGYGREAFFWSFVVAILLFSLGGLFAIYEGVHKLEGHQPISSPWLSIGILVFSIGVEAGSFWACYLEVRKQAGAQSLWTWFKETTAADLLVVFTEDAAALAGLVIALGFLVLAWITGNPFWDAMGSIVIGAVLVIVAVLLAIEIKSLLVGEAPRKDYRTAIALLAKSIMSDAKILRLICLQTGPDEVMIAMKLNPGSVADTASLVRSINAFEKRIKSEFPEVRWLFVEPDLIDS